MTFIAEIKKPFNFVSILIALCSILLSVYFYQASLQKREPRYLIAPSNQIFSKSVSSPKITVVDSSGVTVAGDIHVVEVSFWNDGKLPIELSDVRTPVVIQFPNGYRLLDSKISDEIKPSVSAFTLTEVVGSSEAAQVKVGWKHFDPGTGARFQFIYVGSANPKLIFRGDILDAEITEGVSVVAKYAPTWVIVAVGAVLLLVPVIVATPLSKKIGAGRSRTFVLLIDFLLTVILGGAVLAFLVFIVSPQVAPV